MSTTRPGTETVTIVATGVGVAEGPVWHDGCLWFTRLDGGGAVLRLGGHGGDSRADEDDAGGHVQTVAVTGGGANGLTVAGDGTFYVANDGGRDHAQPSAIQRLTPRRDDAPSGSAAPQDGSATRWGVEVVADAVDGQPFRHCNDLCVGPDGWIWFTDSGEPYSTSKGYFEAGTPPEKPGLVCRLDPADGSVEVVDASLYMPNGLAFSPGDELLYVADTVAHRIVAFPYRDGALAPAARWIEVDGNPDGFCLDVEGRLYVATAIGGEIHVLDPDGRVERRIRWADEALPLNCCFGGDDGSTLYATDAGGMANVTRDPAADHTHERIVAIALDTPGLPLHR